VPDIFLRQGEPNPNDIVLRDPTITSAPPQTLLAGDQFLTVSSPSVALVLAISLLAGAQSITASAPVVKLALVIPAGANSITISAPAPKLNQRLHYNVSLPSISDGMISPNRDVGLELNIDQSSPAFGGVALDKAFLADTGDNTAPSHEFIYPWDVSTFALIFSLRDTWLSRIYPFIPDNSLVWPRTRFQVIVNQSDSEPDLQNLETQYATLVHICRYAPSSGGIVDWFTFPFDSGGFYDVFWEEQDAQGAFGDEDYPIAIVTAETLSGTGTVNVVTGGQRTNSPSVLEAEVFQDTHVIHLSAPALQVPPFTITAGTPSITLSAPAPTLVTTISLLAGNESLTISAPSASIILATSLLAGDQSATLSAPAPAVVTAVTLLAGNQSATLSAPASSLVLTISLLAGDESVTLSAPSPSVALTVALLAGNESITVSAPSSTVVATTTLSAGDQSLTASAPTSTLIAAPPGDTFLAGDESISVSAPSASVIPGDVTVLAGANEVDVVVPDASIFYPPQTLVLTTSPEVWITAPEATLTLGPPPEIPDVVGVPSTGAHPVSRLHLEEVHDFEVVFGGDVEFERHFLGILEVSLSASQNITFGRSIQSVLPISLGLSPTLRVKSVREAVESHPILVEEIEEPSIVSETRLSESDDVVILGLLDEEFALEE
jgi:hypothetical protein